MEILETVAGRRRLSDVDWWARKPEHFVRVWIAVEMPRFDGRLTESFLKVNLRLRTRLWRQFLNMCATSEGGHPPCCGDNGSVLCTSCLYLRLRLRMGSILVYIRICSLL